MTTEHVPIIIPDYILEQISQVAQPTQRSTQEIMDEFLNITQTRLALSEYSSIPVTVLENRENFSMRRLKKYGLRSVSSRAGFRFKSTPEIPSDRKMYYLPDFPIEKLFYTAGVVEWRDNEKPGRYYLMKSVPDQTIAFLIPTDTKQQLIPINQK